MCSRQLKDFTLGVFFPIRELKKGTKLPGKNLMDYQYSCRFKLRPIRTQYAPAVFYHTLY